MPLRAVFLDVGNTLLREEPSRFALYARAAERRGRPVGETGMAERMRRAHQALPEVLDGHYRYTDPWFGAFIEHVFGESLGFPPDEIAELREELFATFEDPASFRLFPGALELLGELRERGLCVGIVSNWSARLPRLLANLGLAERVDFALSSALEGVEKPDERIFRRALERAGVEPGEALHAGDHAVRDVEGARAAGLGAILVDHSGTLAGRVDAGCERVTSLAELGDRVAARLESA